MSQRLSPVKSKATTQELEATIEPTALAAGVSHEAHMKAALEKYDTNGDGVYTKSEVENIIDHVDSAEQEAKNMKGVAMASMLLAALFVGVMYGVNEASKENHIKSDGNGVASELDLAGNNVHTQNSQTQSEITIDGTLSVFPIKRGEDPAKAERVEVGFVARAVFFNGLNEVKSSSRKGTVKYNKGAGRKLLFDYTIAEVTEDQKGTSLAVEVDMPGGIRQFAVACAKAATKCPIYALVPATKTEEEGQLKARQLSAHAARSIAGKWNPTRTRHLSVNDDDDFDYACSGKEAFHRGGCR